MNKKLITVFGATGAQGGGLARAILAEPAVDLAPTGERQGHSFLKTFGNFAPLDSSLSGCAAWTCRLIPF